MTRAPLLSLLCVGVVVSIQSVALAQPGNFTPSYENIRLTEEELEILEQGEISAGRFIAGGIVGTHVGFGVGHIVQGRWSDMGWMFTIGETAAFAAFVYGMADCLEGETYYASDTNGYHDTTTRNDGCNAGLFVGGLIGFAGLRLWEVIDVWTGPPRHNARYRRVRARVGPGYRLSLKPMRNPASGDLAGGVAGLSFQF
jgi:hypothetical protein